MNEINYDNLVFFDLETSGLDHKKHEIIQICAIDGNTGDEFSQLLDFDIDRADPQALESNCFNERRWNRYAVPAKEGLQNFADFVLDHATLDFKNKAGKPYKLAAMAGYNVAGFDKFFLSEAFSKNRILFPGDYRMFDIYFLALWKFPDLTSYKLSAICELLGIEHKDAHDAMGDVKATIEVAKAITSKSLDFKRCKWMQGANNGR